MHFQHCGGSPLLDEQPVLHQTKCLKMNDLHRLSESSNFSICWDTLKCCLSTYGAAPGNLVRGHVSKREHPQRPQNHQQVRDFFWETPRRTKTKSDNPSAFNNQCCHLFPRRRPGFGRRGACLIQHLDFQSLIIGLSRRSWNGKVIKHGDLKFNQLS